MKIIEERADVGLKAFPSVRVFHLIQLPLAGLMYKSQFFLPIAEAGKCIHDCAIDRLSALASSKNEDGIRSDMMLWWNGFEFRPDRIAGNDGTVPKIGLRARIGDGSKIDPFSKHAIGESGNRILFHDDARI